MLQYPASSPVSRPVIRLRPRGGSATLGWPIRFRRGASVGAHDAVGGDGEGLDALPSASTGVSAMDVSPIGEAHRGRDDHGDRRRRQGHHRAEGTGRRADRAGRTVRAIPVDGVGDSTEAGSTDSETRTGRREEPGLAPRTARPRPLAWGDPQLPPSTDRAARSTRAPRRGRTTGIPRSAACGQLDSDRPLRGTAGAGRDTACRQRPGRTPGHRRRRQSGLRGDGERRRVAFGRR